MQYSMTECLHSLNSVCFPILKCQGRREVLLKFTRGVEGIYLQPVHVPNFLQAALQ